VGAILRQDRNELGAILSSGLVEGAILVLDQAEWGDPGLEDQRPGGRIAPLSAVGCSVSGAWRGSPPGSAVR
jgi:hypothetical protein